MCHRKHRNVKKDALGKKLTKKDRRGMLKERNYEGDEYDEWVRLGKLTAARLAWVIVDPNGVITELCPKDMTKGAKSVAVR